MTPAARRAEMAGNIAVLRTLPPCELADRAREITGYQDEEVTCWRCHADLSIRDARPDGGQDWTCTNYDACDERASAEAEEARNEFVIGGTR